MIKKILIVIASIVLVILIYNSIVCQGAFEGQVLDAVTREPIQNANILFTYSLTKACIRVDICESYVLKEFKTSTDQNGNYAIPSFFALKHSFLDHSPYIYIAIPVGNLLKEEYQNSPWLNRYQQTGLVNEYYLESINTGRSSYNYPIDIKSTLSRQKVNIILTPKLNDSIESCKLIQETFSRIKCITLNSLDLALKKGDVSFCDNLDETGQPCKMEKCTGDFISEDMDILGCKNSVYGELAVRERNDSYCYKIDKGGCPGCYPKEMFINECIERVGRFSNLS